MSKTSSVTISKIESGDTTPSKTTIKKIAKVLNVPSIYLMWHGLTEDCVPEEKRYVFNALKPHMDEMMDALFIN